MDGVDEQRQESASNEQALRLARLYRHAHALGLSQTVQAEIQAHIIAKLGFDRERGEVGPAGEPAAARGAEDEGVEDIPLADAELWKASAHHCELKLRQLIQGKAAWPLLAPYAWHWLGLRPDADVAARLVEFAYLYGDGNQAAQVVSDLGKRGMEFYARIHPAIRVQLLLTQWRTCEGEKLLALLLGEKDGAWLDPVERLCLFIYFCKHDEASLPYLYYKHYDKELAAGVKSAGDYLKVSQPTLQFWVARLAVKLGYLKDAAEYIKAIDPREREYADALKLLQGLGSHHDLVSKSEWGAELLRFPDPEERLRLLGVYFERVAAEQGGVDLNRLALNAVLEDPLSWLPRQPALWSKLAELLISYQHLASELPNLLQVFVGNATTLFEAACDGALWQRFIPVDGSPKPAQPYLAGVALVHFYILKGGDEPEESLWLARRLILEFEEEAGKPLHPPYLAWDKLQRWALAMVEAANFIPPLKKKILGAQLRMASTPERCTIQDLSDYLAANPKPPIAILSQLQVLAVSKEAHDVELQLLIKAGRGAHLTNAELLRIWQLAGKRQRADLAWRAATILLARGHQAAHLKQAWAICGENRKNYPWQKLQAADLDCCLLDFAPEESRLVWACLKLATMVPALLSESDPNVQMLRPRDHSDQARLVKIEAHLATVKWFGPLKKDYRVGEQGLMPAFAEALPDNTWSLLTATIAHRMGMAAWRWRLSRLRSGVSALSPKSKNNWQMFQREQSGAARWLRSLTSEQRSAWHDLVNISQKIDDERGFRVLACFVCRLATVLYPHHHQALSSLREMRVPVFLIWDLECWLLSDEYSRLRHLRATEHKTPVPTALLEP